MQIWMGSDLTVESGTNSYTPVNEVVVETAAYVVVFADLGTGAGEGIDISVQTTIGDGTPVEIETYSFGPTDGAHAFYSDPVPLGSGQALIVNVDATVTADHVCSWQVWKL